MATPEGRALPFTGPEHVDVAVLETFPYEGPEQEIVTETDEFSAVCPYSGLPDFATLTVTYVPGDRCIELKSLKYYVTSYRNVGIFQEHATAKIAEDLFRVLAAPDYHRGDGVQRAGWVPDHLQVTLPTARLTLQSPECKERPAGTLPAPLFALPADSVSYSPYRTSPGPAARPSRGVTSRVSARGAAAPAGWPVRTPSPP